MFRLFPYVFTNTFNMVINGIDLLDNIVDNVMNSGVVDNIISSMENIETIDLNFKEHKNAYTIECYLPTVKKENITIEYYNNYITINIKRNMFYTNNENIAMAVIQPGGDIEEDYYVENIEPEGIRAVFKNGMLKVLIPKRSYIGKDTKIVEVKSFNIENKDSNIISKGT